MGNVLDRQADQVSRAGRSYRLGCSNGTGGGGMAMRRLDRRKEDERLRGQGSGALATGDGVGQRI